jgi:hypothetical protein
MESLSKKSFDAADEVRTPDKTKLEVVNLGTTVAGRMTAQPGWKWSECIKPVVGGDSCQALHIGAAISGKLHVKHDDGTEIDLVPGDAYTIQPGHDAWVVGNEAFVALEFQSETAETFAKP